MYRVYANWPANTGTAHNDDRGRCNHRPGMKGNTESGRMGRAGAYVRRSVLARPLSGPTEGAGLNLL